MIEIYYEDPRTTFFIPGLFIFFFFFELNVLTPKELKRL